MLRFFSRQIFATFFAIAFCGCANFNKKQPPQLEAPKIEVRQTTFAGSPLSGPTTLEVKADSAPPLLASVQILALRNDPGAIGQPIGAAAKLISANRGPSFLQPSVSLFTRARVNLDGSATQDFSKLNDPASIRSVIVSTTPARAILAGATSVSSLSFLENGTLELSLNRQQNASSISVAIRAIVPQAASTTPVTETAILDPLDVANPRQLLITLPESPSGTQAKAMAIFVEVAPPADDEQYVAALKQAQDQLKQSADIARSRPTTATVGSASASGYQNSLDALKDPARRRAALIYLSSETGAAICEDFSLAAEDALIERAIAKINESLPPEASEQRDLLGWILDRSTLLLLAELSADTKNKIAPELIAVLTRHAGEAGRHDSSMEPVVKNLQSRADLENRLIAENLIYLEDNSLPRECGHTTS